MTNRIIIKKSSVAAKVPQPDDLLYGELALNYADGKLYYKNSNNAVNVLGTNLTVGVTNGVDSTEAFDVKSIRFTNPNFTLTNLGGSVVEIGFNQGTTSANPLVFSTDSNYRTLTGYTESGVTYSVRTAEFVNNKLRLTLADFTPTLSATITPATSLSWDVPCTGFTVNVVNPDDFTDQWISSVSTISATTGSVSNISTFTANSKSATPAGGVDWTQTFVADVDSYIRPNVTSGLAGGSATGTVKFVVSSALSSSEYANPASWSVAWSTPAHSINMANLSGRTFLQTYTSTTYTVSVTGVASAANYVNSVTATGGTVNNNTGSGTFTFAEPIHKDNTTTPRTVELSTTFTRPASVTGTQYSTQIATSDLTLSATFTYPSFWLFTESVQTQPTVDNVVLGTAFASGVTALGDQVRTLNGFINNPLSVPQAFWFAVRSAAAQPTAFKTGASSSLLSDVSVTTGYTVSLVPTPTPAGFNAVQYTLYGITLQPGSTYVSIS